LLGVINRANLSLQLISHGMQSDMPVALVQWGTTPRQFTVSGTLDNIVERVKSAGLKSPAIIIVGGVVKLRETMKWFENRPLSGKRIVVTRAREQASDMI
jgi:uroporphyrinogen III methyltransferase/synthase